MPVENIHSYLVHPAKNADQQPPIHGTTIAHEGGLFKMLRDVYRRASDECNIDIAFMPDDEDAQNNPCHDDLIGYCEAPAIRSGRSIAQRLQQVTTHRSGLGLLFLLQGTTDEGRHKLVISRFPADQGVVAEEDEERLSVEFVDRVFMKSAHAYKSAYYTTRSLEAGFMDGSAVDRQISGPKDLSDYWIREFLKSELKTTGPAGSRRLAIALRQAVRTAGTADLKQELISAAQLIRNQGGQVFSARELVNRLGLSDQAVSRIESGFSRSELMNEAFELDAQEFSRHSAYRSVELDNGAMLTAEDARFDDVFESERLAAEDRVRYSTEGAVVDQKLKKTK